MTIWFTIKGRAGGFRYFSEFDNCAATRTRSVWPCLSHILRWFSSFFSAATSMIIKDGVSTSYRSWFRQRGPPRCCHAACPRGAIECQRPNLPQGSALSLAARHGSLPVVDSILQYRRTDRNCADGRGRTALWCAAYEGQTTIVERLLAGTDIRVNVEGNK